MNYRRYYSSGRCYFFTHTLNDRSQQTLTNHIEQLRSAFQESKEQQPFKLIACCVLPDHLHALLSLPFEDTDYPKLWSRIKGNFSRKIPAAEPVSSAQTRRKERGIWQKRYWEHEIRNEKDLEQHIHYIHLNPLKHGLVKSVREWPYSSFHKFLMRGWLEPGWEKVQFPSSNGYGESRR